MEPMIFGPYGVRDPYCHPMDLNEIGKIGSMRAKDPWTGPCAPKIFQAEDGLFYIIQWRMSGVTGKFC